MVLATVAWRAGRARRLAAAEDRMLSGRVRFIESDRFLDLVVLTSVVMFLLLAVGVGMLALQISGLR